MVEKYGTPLNRPDNSVPLPKEFTDKLRESLQKAKLDPDADLGKVDTKVPCQANCKGTLVKETTRQYLGDPMNAIIGPGHRSQLTTIVKLYCSRCGIMYHHLPEVPRCDEVG